MNKTVEIIFGLVGGLAIFIFGMNMMSECLQKAAGDKMKKILSMLTKNPVLGVCVGTIMTLVVQSSSATIAVLQNFASQAGPDGQQLRESDRYRIKSGEFQGVFRR